MERTFKKFVSYVLLSVLFFGMIAPALPSEAAPAATTKWVTFKYDDFSDSNLSNVLSLNGKSAVVSDGAVSPKPILRLNSTVDGYNGFHNTPGSVGSYGTVFSKQKIYSQNNFSFSTYFSFRFTGQGFAPGFNNLTYNPSGIFGADGITFTVQTMQSNAGTPGGGMGYSGITPSFAIKFDTYKNPELGDPSDSYIGLGVNGIINNTLPTYDLLSQKGYKLKDGSVYHAWVDYDGSTKNVKVYINRNSNSRNTATKALDVNNVNLGSIFANQDAVFAGFTASTGGAWENHDILNWYFTNKVDPIDTTDPNSTYQQAPITVAITPAVNSKLGKTQLTVTAKDASGNPVANVPITLKADSGTIENLNGQPITPVPAVVNADANGQVQVLLNMGSTPNVTPGNVTAIAEGGAYSVLAIPPSPTNLRTSVVTNTGATLAWNAVTGATSYQLFDNDTLLTTVSNTTYSVTGLVAGISHTYTVTAVKNNVQSAPSASVNVTAPVPAPTLPASPSPGSNPNTTKVTTPVGAGNHLLTKVSSSLIPTPNVGDAAPTGAGITNPYTPGADITGVDAITNRYIGIYEVDSTNKVVSFKLIILTAGDIKESTPAQYIVDLLTYPSNELLQVGASQALVTTAVYSDQSIFDVTDKATYNTTDPTVATVDASGIVTAISEGTTVITVEYGGKSTSVVFTVQVGIPDIRLDLTASPASVVGDGRSLITLKASAIRLVDGNPVEGKTITFQGIGNTTQTAVTDATGTAVVTFTAPAISGVLPVHNTITASAVDSTGLMAQTSIAVHYMPATVHGVLTDNTTGKPIAGAVVSVSTDFNGDGIVDFSQEVTTGADGSYQIYVPRGNWNYSMNIQTPVTIGNQTVMLNKTQTAQVGTLNGTEQIFTAANNISGQLLIAQTAAENGNPQPTIDSLFGAGNVSAIVQGTGANNFKSQIVLDANGSFDVNNVPQGQYIVAYQIKASDGTILAGPTVTVNVNQNGEMSVVYSLIDPYGVVKDAVTGQPVSGVSMNLYWADTELNKQKGRTPNTLVALPELPGFAPNQNHNPQVTNADGEYAWMVFPDGDYYIVATKPGYGTFNTLTEQTSVTPDPGSDSYIQNGIIHVGQSLVQFSFSMQPLKESNSGSGNSGSTNSGNARNNAPGDLTTSNGTQTGVTLSWTPVTGASSYNIYDNGKLIASGITGTRYEITGLEAGTKHSFTVSAIVSGVESKLSESLTFTTLGSTVNPSTPQDAQHHEKYINGYPDGTFKPAKNITRQEVAALLFRVYQLSKSVTDGTAYSDVSSSDWGAEEIAAVTKVGMMNGYPDGTFRPNQPISREEMAGIAARLKHLQGKGDNVFTDISGSWAREPINSAAEAGILKGYEDGTFRPKKNMTRAEAVTMINRLTSRGPLAGVVIPSWSDVSPSHWAYGDIEEASVDHDYIIQDGTERRVEQGK
ncbi:S-layer homology domain-containing protein [Paenibacillus sp. NPDC057934]|uniref:S-layer homology domain-containing protein n=1 Tax=Paenibacillus sp. NPDC057934 TaxID=3346282 RepID=UPI0036D78571